MMAPAVTQELSAPSAAVPVVQATADDNPR
jgi:hypothetical protein